MVQIDESGVQSAAKYVCHFAGVSVMIHNDISTDIPPPPIRVVHASVLAYASSAYMSSRTLRPDRPVDKYVHELDFFDLVSELQLLVRERGAGGSVRDLVEGGVG